MWFTPVKLNETFLMLLPLTDKSPPMNKTTLFIYLFLILIGIQSYSQPPSCDSIYTSFSAAEYHVNDKILAPEVLLYCAF